MSVRLYPSSPSLFFFLLHPHRCCCYSFYLFFGWFWFPLNHGSHLIIIFFFLFFLSPFFPLHLIIIMVFGFHGKKKKEKKGWCTRNEKSGWNSVFGFFLFVFSHTNYKQRATLESVLPQGPKNVTATRSWAFLYRTRGTDLGPRPVDLDPISVWYCSSRRNERRIQQSSSTWEIGWKDMCLVNG